MESAKKAQAKSDKRVTEQGMPDAYGSGDLQVP